MSLLPFTYKDNLKPWFKENDLEKGWDLLTADLAVKLFFRNFWGGFFSGEDAEGRAVVRFATAPKLKQGFKIDSPFCSCCSRKQSLGNFCSHVAALALALISCLKQLCDHPCLVIRENDLEQYGCGKWDLFKELLHECLDGGYKVVVFSQYTSMLDLIEGYLQSLAFSWAGLRGGMTLKKRKEEISRFQNEESCRVFCASLLAGGTGIDLTAAQCVIHYDRWWNAAREDQATSRVHRIGQNRVVEVFKLITAGALEEKIDQLIGRRRKLAGRLVQVDDENLVKRLDRKDLLDLLSF